MRVFPCYDVVDKTKCIKSSRVGQTFNIAVSKCVLVCVLIKVLLASVCLCVTQIYRSTIRRHHVGSRGQFLVSGARGSGDLWPVGTAQRDRGELANVVASPLNTKVTNDPRVVFVE